MGRRFGIEFPDEVEFPGKVAFPGQPATRVTFVFDRLPRHLRADP